MAKVKIELKKGETPDEAEEQLLKAMKRKRECSGHERFADEPINEFLDKVCKNHADILKRINKEVKEEIQEYLRNK